MIYLDQLKPGMIIKCIKISGAVNTGDRFRLVEHRQNHWVVENLFGDEDDWKLSFAFPAHWVIDEPELEYV